MARTAKTKNRTTANIGFEEKLWLAADKLRNNMDAAEYKHVVLGLVFLKYISDTFEAHHSKLVAGKGDYKDSDPEDQDEYRAENVFWVPPAARWAYLQNSAKQTTIGKIVDDAMVAIERDNPRLKGVLPKDYARPGLDKQRLGELIDLIGTITLIATPSELGTGKTHRSVDLLGRVYEYFLTKFASAEGKNGGQFYTPSCVVRLLVGMLAPYKGRVYDPCCGSGGMFVQSEKFVVEHGGRIGDISVYGQESNATTRKLALMNLAIRGIEADFGEEQADTFRRDLHPDLKADFVLANPPFNDSDWFRKDDDVRWAYGIPPKGNANFAWVQHFIYHLAPRGMAGFVLANGSMSSNKSGEGEIRKALVEADLVDCMVALPGHLFYNMYSQVCVWFLAKNKQNTGWRERTGETLFIDARNLGTMTDRTHRELSDDDIMTVSNTYHAWSRPNYPRLYADIPGFCKATNLGTIRKKSYNLIPARYVGSEEMGSVDLPFEEALAGIKDRLSPLVAEMANRTTATTTHLDNLLLAKSARKQPSKQTKQKSDLSVAELSNQICDAYADFAKVLFRSWFVDFEPSILKSQGHKPKLPMEIAQLFPSEFEDSELGEIPKGWRIGTYAEILAPVSSRIGELKAPEYSATVRGLELRELRFNKQLAHAQTKNKKICKNDLVFGLSRKVINFGLMTGDIGSVSPVYEIFQVRSDVYVPELLELYIRYYMRMHIDILKSGAREGAPIDREYLLSKEVLIPDYRVQLAFIRIVKGTV